jgi:prepilin-type N-terminal cleavage/methylation domain-containing protein
MKRAANPPSGFTLLEVLVALAVAGLVYAAVASGLRLAIQVRSKQAALRKDSWALADGWQAARRALAAMDPGSSAWPGVVAASTNRVTFTAALPEAAAQLVDASLRVDDRHRLLLLWAPRDARGASPGGAGPGGAGPGGAGPGGAGPGGAGPGGAGPGGAGPGGASPGGASEQRVLADGVAALTIGYRATGAAGAWQPDWNGPGLPGLVRLSVTWTDHARRPWPPIIAGPKFTVPRD